jgi:ubiquinone biosynthesis protein COQ4
MLDGTVADNFLRFANDNQTNGVPELHFRFWKEGDEQARQRYVERFRADERAMAWVDEGYQANDPDVDELLGLGPDTLGHQFARHLLDNGLSRTIASDYRTAHEDLAAKGVLDSMPHEIQYAVLRGFQIHDWMHIITGHLTDGPGEIALQAFTLAQRELPYSAMWIAGLTTQMTFVHPHMTTTVMDCIAAGWQLGCTTKNLSYEKWEERVAEPVSELRREFGFDPAGHAIR